MNTLIQFLSGKKTYLVAFLGVIYAGLVSQGYVHENQQVWELLGALGLASIRSAVKAHAKDQADAIAEHSGLISELSDLLAQGRSIPATLPVTPAAPAANSAAGRTDSGRAAISLLALVALPLFLFWAAMGCAHLQPGADPLVVRTEQTEQLAVSTFDLVLGVDNDNRPFWRTNAPAFHEFCEWLRQPQTVGTNTLPRSLAIVRSLDDIKVAYTRSQADSNSVVTALSTLNATMLQATSWLTIITNAQPVAPAH